MLCPISRVYVRSCRPVFTGVWKIFYSEEIQTLGAQRVQILFFLHLGIEHGVECPSCRRCGLLLKNSQILSLRLEVKHLCDACMYVNPLVHLILKGPRTQIIGS